MLATLGVFVFTLKTAPFQQLRRATGWRWVGNNRHGRRAAYQFAGPGDDIITLSGVLLPEITGGPTTLDALRLMGDQGKAWPFIGGDGTIYGLWIIENVEETKTVFFENGTARKIEFSLSLKRADDTRIDQLGALTRIGLGLLT
jgi:phage protein U